MTDTIRALSALQTLFADNTTRAISEQDLRDFLVSVLGVVPFIAKAADYGLTSDDYFVAVDESGGAVALTLPASASTRVGKVYELINLSGSNAAEFKRAGSDTLNGGTSNIGTSTQWTVARAVNAGGGAWYVMIMAAP